VGWIRRRKMWGGIEGGRGGVEARWAWCGWKQDWHGGVGWKRDGRGWGGEVGWKRDSRVSRIFRNVGAATHWSYDVGKGLRKRCEATNVTV